MIKKILITAIFTILNSMCCAFTMKASVGLSPFDALSNSCALTTNIKVGYWIILINVLVFIFSSIYNIKEFKITNLFQVVMPTLTGVCVNFFYYDLFHFELNGYVLCLIVFWIANICSACCVAFIMKADFTTYPIEGLCKVLEKKTNKSFAFYRTSADVIMIAISLFLTLLFKVPLQIREGTIISMCEYGFFTQLCYKRIEKLF